MIVTKMTLSLFYAHIKRDYLKNLRRQGLPFDNPKIDDEKGKEEIN
jgi:Fe-S cluster assembly iron-binding protein IscA